MLLFMSFLSFVSCAFASEPLTPNIRPSAWSNIKHVVIVVLENQSARVAEKKPFLKSLIAKGAYFSNYYAVAHPSQPNYIAMTAGSQLGVYSNHMVTLNTTHIGTLLDNKNLTWKVYAEGFPGNCYKGATKGAYARRHLPFISYKNIQDNPKLCERIVKAEEFFKDIAAHDLPTYAFYVPNNKNNGHDTSIKHADQWLKRTFQAVFNNPDYLKDTLFVVTFDEDDGSQNNKIYTVFLGAGVKVGTRSVTHYTAYSLLRTIEEIFELGTLRRNDEIATPIKDVWLS